MTNRIDLNSTLPSILAQNQSRSAGQTSSETVSPVAAGSSLSLTESASRLNQISANSSSEASFDAAKVGAIRAAVADGSYRVDAAKVANNLLRIEQEISA